MRILTIVGARPQFIKMAPVSRELMKYAEEIIVHTGQHYDKSMSDVFFDELNIPKPHYHLHVGSKNHGAQTGEMLAKIEEVINKEKPTAVLVYGDTNSTLAGALAACKLHIPVAHVEAGLRSYNLRMPEEINRILTDHISKWLFCPTQTSLECLNNTEINGEAYLTGDVMLDAVNYNQVLAKEKLPITKILDNIGIKQTDYFLFTLHRAENTDQYEHLNAIVSALNEFDILTLFPIHPRTKAKLEDFKLTITNPLIRLIDPVGYLEMLQLESHAKKILTDSGGVQKEAFFVQVPCITLRNETEWVETIDLKTNILVGADKRKIIEATHHFDVDFSTIQPVFGNGRASEKIVKQLVDDLQKKR